MKKTIFLLLTFFFFTTTFLRGQKIPPMEPNQTIDGKREGQWLLWLDENLQFTEEIKEAYAYIVAPYESGIVQGEVIIYDLDKVPILKGVYKDDELIGDWIEIKNLSQEVWSTKIQEGIKYYDLGDYQTAVFYTEDALEFAKSELGVEHKSYRTSLSYLALIYKSMGEYSKALSLYYELLEITEKNLGKDDSSYAKYLNNIASIHYHLDEYSKALSSYHEVLEITEKNLGKDDLSYAKYLNNIARLYVEIGNYTDALSLYIKYFDEVYDSLDRTDSSYVTSLNNLAAIYVNIDEPLKAIPLLEEALETAEKFLDEGHSSYENTLNNLASLYEIVEEYSKAMTLHMKALKITEKKLGADHPTYVKKLEDLALQYVVLGEYPNAITLYLEALEITKRKYGGNHISANYPLSTIAKLYFKMGEYRKAVSFYLELLENTEYNYVKEYPDYGDYLYKTALSYSNLYEYLNALPFYLQAVEHARESLGVKDPEYIRRVNSLAILYQSLGVYSKALPLHLEALELAEQSLGKNSPTYADYLNNLALLYQNMGELSKALALYLEVLESSERVYGKESQSYMTSLNNIASIYEDMGEYTTALTFFKETMAFAKKHSEEDYSTYINRLNSLAGLYFELEDFSQALNLYLEAYDLTIDKYGEEHPIYRTLVGNLALNYGLLDEYNMMFAFLKKDLEQLYKEINQNLVFLTELEKEQFLQKKYDEIGFYLRIFISFFKNYSSVASLAFNYELVFKNLILNSSIDLQKRIAESSDKELKEKFEELRMLKMALSNEYNKPVAGRRADIKEVESRAEKLEGEINRKTNQLSQKLQIGKIKWEDVQERLKEDETAIEFASFWYFSGKDWTKTIQYTALVLKKGDKHPVLIPLFTQNDLDKVLTAAGNENEKIDQVYTNPELYNLIWKPLEAYLKEGETIYFAPSGTLHQIAFSAIQTPDGEYLSDKYKLHPVSSTSKILEKREEEKIKDITLFGDIDYDVGYDKIATKVKAKTQEELYATRSLPEDLDRGGSTWSYLPGTREEIKNIEKLAAKFGVQAQLYSGDNAAEENFKALNGSDSPQVLHIATHGFFFPDPEKETPDNRMILLDDERPNPFKLSDNPLNRAGLLFAGANNTWKGNKPKENIDDGILTAYEANNVYLPNTELVVLSACDTGLGEIRGSEGVYGLQRAFKAAGAEYLLMSLWKVPDKETTEFMEAFYDELFKTDSIYDSYISAQNHMKEKYKDNPYKWAAFVLLR